MLQNLLTFLLMTIISMSSCGGVHDIIYTDFYAARDVWVHEMNTYKPYCDQETTEYHRMAAINGLQHISRPPPGV
jgi:hypothetical protein